MRYGVQTEAWAVNASPLILFSRIDRLDLIERLAPGVMVPDRVIVEVGDGAHKDATARRAITWAERFRVSDLDLPATVERWNLGPGESQVISHCLQGRRWAVLDDQMARRCVQSLGLTMIGSIGIVLRAKEHGLIDTARPWVYRLMDAGMFVSDALIERALNAIGEPS
jgi:predicted nucleic acid-binding protein